MLFVDPLMEQEKESSNLKSDRLLLRVGLL